MFDLANCNLEEQGVGIWETTSTFNILDIKRVERTRTEQNRIRLIGRVLFQECLRHRARGGLRRTRRHQVETWREFLIDQQ